MNAHGMAALEICDFGPLVGSPWVLGFEDSDTVRIYLVTGTIVAALAAVKVWLVHQGDRRITLVGN